MLDNNPIEESQINIWFLFTFISSCSLLHYYKKKKKTKRDQGNNGIVFNERYGQWTITISFIICKKKKVKIEVNKIMNPAFLLGTAFNIAYWHRKYHSGTICKGVSNPQTSNAFTGCEKEEIPKCVPRRVPTVSLST